MGEEKAAPPMGLVTKRKCHDAIFLIIMLAFWVGMWLIANTALKYGNPMLLLKPQDSYGNRCGTAKVQNGISLLDRPFLYYNNPAQPAAAPSICIAECPSVTTYPTIGNNICNYGITLTDANFAENTAKFQCAPLIIQSKPIMNKCIPSDPSATSFAASAASDASSKMQDIFQDVMVAWPYYIAAALLSLAVAYIWVYFLRLFAKVMVWLTIIIINLVFAAISGACYYVWVLQQSVIDNSNSVPDYVVFTRDAGKYGCFVFLALFVLMVIFTIFMRNKIRIACEVLKETSIAIGKMPYIIIFPLFLWAGCVILLVYFIVIALYLVSIDDGVTLSGLNIELRDKYTVYYLLIYHCFGFFWMYAFLQGVNQTTISGSFAAYYWVLDKMDMQKHPITKSAYRTIRYHLGSIAFGSMLIAIVQTLRVIMLLFKRMAKKSKLKFLIPIIDCCQCYLKWLEELVKWISKNGYILVAIEGENFCKSCTTALGLLTRNVLRLIAVDLVGDMIIILSKVCITASTVMILYAFISWQSKLIVIQIIYIPLVICGLIAFFVASAFMSVYALGIDSIFMCFLIDVEKNDGSPAKPFYMSESLKNIMHVSNKMQEESAKKLSKRVEPMAIEEY
ncbi:hypothetical protein HDU77_003817 [Chytriomyces hyalinus]|nr:hypothetical protein HDU77_003817 [Chytriomyces hyalinus]